MGPLCAMLRSLCHHNKGQSIRLFVAHTSLTAQDFEKIEAALDPSFCKVENVHVPADRFPGLPFSDRWPPEACYRLFAAHILPKDIDRVLYLDPDIIIIKPLKELYELDLKGNYYAASTHMISLLKPISRWRLSLPSGCLYVNSGVLLMDLEKLRAEQKETDIFDYYEKNKRRIRLFDQDMLNGVYCEKILHIDPLLYNLDDRYYLLYQLATFRKSKKIDLDWVDKNTVILHYCGRKKPWHDDYPGRFGDYYHKFSK